MRANFFNFAKMQVAALSQIVWLQLLCIALFPMFFSQVNAGNDFANTFTYTIVLIMLSYLILRNFAFNDSRHKTKLLFSILPITPKAIIGARGVIIYLFCLTATPLLLLFSNLLHLLMPEKFASIPIHILPNGILLAAVFLPIEFMLFYLFEAQKADIIAALAPFLYMAILFPLYKYLLNSPLWIMVLILAVLINAVCYKAVQKLYSDKQE